MGTNGRITNAAGEVVDDEISGCCCCLGKRPDGRWIWTCYYTQKAFHSEFCEKVKTDVRITNSAKGLFIKRQIPTNLWGKGRRDV